MNDMTDFDKLIKEKAEQASYSYDEAAWRQYKRKAGLHGGSAKYCLVGTAALVVAGIFLLLKPGHQAQESQNQPTQMDVVASDSSLALQNPSNETLEDTLTLRPDKETKGRPLKVSRHHTETVDASKVQMKKDTPKVSRKVIYGKPIAIDVDTITRMVPTDEELEKGHSRLY